MKEPSQIAASHAASGESVVSAISAKDMSVELRKRAMDPSRQRAARFRCNAACEAGSFPSLQTLDQLLNHLVGATEQRHREGEIERLGRLEVDNELDLCKKLDR